jgi:hypothetical protein
MSINISDYTSVRQRTVDLGCRYPSGFALLPVNFDLATSVSEFRNVVEAASVKKLLRSAGLPLEDVVERTSRGPYIQNNDFGWAAPTLFISAALLSESPHLVAVALSTIANYATDFLKGITGDKSLKMDIVVERGKGTTCKKVSYEGPPEGLRDLADVIRAMSDE